MIRISRHPLNPNAPARWLMSGAWLLGITLGGVRAEGERQAQDVPRVVVRTSGQQLRPSLAASRILYPWKTFVTCSIFWVGERPTAANPTPNHKSSWDQKWVENFGGYDDPRPEKRIASHSRGEFRPKAFVPKLNPFYVALPYNDISPKGGYKPEAPRVIPWFDRVQPSYGRSVCQGRWVQIFKGGRSCYAQWEDCGPWLTDDWPFVFGNQPPKNKRNRSAGIDLSPAVRDYLMLKSHDKVHWRFVEDGQVPYGPWKKYGQQPAAEEPSSLEAQRKYLEYLRKLRDEQFLKKPLRELQ